MMALSGVRSSWFILATNCDLCSLAISNWRLLFWISLSNRPFSMAMTACRAKLVTSSICLSGERTDFLAVNADDADQLIVLEHRDAENSAITAERDRSDHKWIALDVSLRSRNVGDLGDLLRVWLHSSGMTW